MNKFTILSGVALFAVAGVAAAQPGPAQRGQRGVDVTQQQFLARAEQRFARLDANGDGRVAREEAQQARQQHRAQREQRRAERLARLTPEQRAAIEQRRARRGEMARLTPEQRAERRAQMVRLTPEQREQRRAERLARLTPEQRARIEQRRAERLARVTPEQRARNEQLRAQGFITREQFRERALARFVRLDLDRNGTVTMAERLQLRQQRIQRRLERISRDN